MHNIGNSKKIKSNFVNEIEQCLPKSFKPMFKHSNQKAKFYTNNDSNFISRYL